MRFWLCVLFTLVPSVAIVAAESASEKARFLSALRERKLTNLELLVSRSLLDTKELSVEERWETAFDAARTINAQGFEKADSAQRQAMWNEADQIVTTEIEQLGNKGRGSMARYQWAGVLIQRSDRLSIYAKVAPDPEQVRGEAENAINLAMKMLETAGPSILQELDTRNPEKAPAPNELPWNQTADLSTVINYRMGQAWLSQARIDADANKKNTAIDRARTLLTPYGNAKPTQPIQWEAEIMLAEVDQLAGKNDDVLKRLRHLTSLKMPEDPGRRVRLMLAKAELAQGKADETIKVLESASKQNPSPEAELVLMEALFRRGRELQKSAPRTTDQYRTKALALLKQLTDRGPYWKKRADEVIAQSLELADVRNDSSLLRRWIETKRAGGDKANSADGLRRWIDLMIAKKGDKEEIASGRLMLAAWLFEDGNFAGAESEFDRFVREFPDHPRAPKASLSAILSHERQLSSPPKPEEAKIFREKLDLHRQKFPNDPTISEIASLTARMASVEGNDAAAMEAYNAIDPSSTRFPSALQGMALRQYRWVTSPKPDQHKSEIEKAIAELRKMIEAAAPKSTSDEERKRTFAVAQFVLASLLAMPVINQSDEAFTLLKDQVLPSNALPAEIQPRAARLLTELAITRRDYKEASALISRYFEESPDALLPLMAKYDVDPADASAEHSELAPVLAMAATKLLDGKKALNPANRFESRRVLAETKILSGHYDEAKSLLVPLMAEQPKHVRIETDIAIAAFKQGNYEESFKHWVSAQKRLQRGSPAWMRATKYAIACQRRMGKKSEADQTLARIRELYPDAAATAFKDLDQLSGK